MNNKFITDIPYHKRFFDLYAKDKLDIFQVYRLLKHDAASKDLIHKFLEVNKRINTYVTDASTSVNPPTGGLIPDDVNITNYVLKEKEALFKTLKVKQSTIGDIISKYETKDHMKQPNTFQLMTYNVYENGCKLKSSSVAINENDPKIVCIQEDTHTDPVNYNILLKGGKNNEKVGVYYKTDFDYDTTQHKTIVDDRDYIMQFKNSTQGALPVRTGILFKYKNLLIANVHLEGGRYSDQELVKRIISDDKPPKKSEQFDDILKKKLVLLNKVIDEGANIIVGDFNSVYASNDALKTQFLQGQYDYFKNFIFKDSYKPAFDNKIKDWNLAAFQLLISKGYTYSIPSNENSAVTSGLGKTIVDFIWYKKDDARFTLTNTNIIPIMHIPFNSGACHGSDHNPVITTITINP
jgi:exonuclease III